MSSSEDKEVAELVAEAAELFKVNAEAIRCRTTAATPKVGQARAFVWLVLQSRGWTWVRLGEYFGRDHRTVMVGVRRLQEKAIEGELLAARIRRFAGKEAL